MVSEATEINNEEEQATPTTSTEINSNWSDKETTTTEMDDEDNEDQEQESLIKSSNNSTDEKKTRKFTDDDDYSYLDTIERVKRMIDLLVPPQLLSVIGSILFTSICLFALVKSHIFHSDQSSRYPIAGQMLNSGLKYECAPWIPQEQRRVILRKHHRLNDWRSYQNGEGYLGGEGYWSASLMFVLQSLGFEVEVDGHNPYGNAEDMERIRNGEIYRIIVDADYNQDEVTDEALGDPDVLCKVRHLEWWDKPDEKLLEQYEDPRQVLTPYIFPGSKATGMPFFVHSEVTLPPITKIESRGRTAYLHHKECGFPKVIVQGLLQAGYELHLTCFGDLRKHIDPMVPDKYIDKVIHHSKLTTIELSKVLRKVSMVIGFGDPRNSPTHYEGLANGAALLNPVSANGKQSQHSILQNLGAPYVYNYLKSTDEAERLKNILEMAEMAVSNPFGSHIPFDHRFDVVRQRVCANLIETDSICNCDKMNLEYDGSHPEIDFCATP